MGHSCPSGALLLAGYRSRPAVGRWKALVVVPASTRFMAIVGQAGSFGSAKWRGLRAHKLAAIENSNIDAVPS